MDDNETDCRPCPYCAEPIKAAAAKCKHCGEWLAEPPRAKRKRRQYPAILLPLAVTLVALFASAVVPPYALYLATYAPSKDTVKALASARDYFAKLYAEDPNFAMEGPPTSKSIGGARVGINGTLTLTGPNGAPVEHKYFYTATRNAGDAELHPWLVMLDGDVIYRQDEAEEE